MSPSLKQLFHSGEAQEFLSAEDRVVERVISKLGILVLERALEIGPNIACARKALTQLVSCLSSVVWMLS